MRGYRSENRRDGKVLSSLSCMLFRVKLKQDADVALPNAPERSQATKVALAELLKTLAPPKAKIETRGCLEAIMAMPISFLLLFRKSNSKSSFDSQFRKEKAKSGAAVPSFQPHSL